MKINEGFELRTVCSENVIVAYGRKNIDFSKVISLNESAALMWRQAEKGEFSAQTLADALCDEYQVDAYTALRDVTQTIEEWQKIGLVEE